MDFYLGYISFGLVDEEKMGIMWGVKIVNETIFIIMKFIKTKFMMKMN